MPVGDTDQWVNCLSRGKLHIGQQAWTFLCPAKLHSLGTGAGSAILARPVHHAGAGQWKFVHKWYGPRKPRWKRTWAVNSQSRRRPLVVSPISLAMDTGAHNSFGQKVDFLGNAWKKISSHTRRCCKKIFWTQNQNKMSLRKCLEQERPKKMEGGTHNHFHPLCRLRVLKQHWHWIPVTAHDKHL